MKVVFELLQQVFLVLSVLVGTSVAFVANVHAFYVLVELVLWQRLHLLRHVHFVQMVVHLLRAILLWVHLLNFVLSLIVVFIEALHPRGRSFAHKISFECRKHVEVIVDDLDQSFSGRSVQDMLSRRVSVGDFLGWLSSVFLLSDLLVQVAHHAHFQLDFRMNLVVELVLEHFALFECVLEKLHELANLLFDFSVFGAELVDELFSVFESVGDSFAVDVADALSDIIGVIHGVADVDVLDVDKLGEGASDHRLGHQFGQVGEDVRLEHAVDARILLAERLEGQELGTLLLAVAVHARLQVRPRQRPTHRHDLLAELEIRENVDELLEQQKQVVLDLCSVAVDDLQHHDFQGVGGQQPVMRAQDAGFEATEGFNEDDSHFEEVVGGDQLVDLLQEALGDHAAHLVERDVHVDVVQCQFEHLHASVDAVAVRYPLLVFLLYYVIQYVF